MRRHALVLLLLAGCADLATMTVEEPELCITLENRKVEGTVDPLLTKTFDYDFGPALPDEAGADNVDMVVRLLSLELRLTDPQPATAGEPVQDFRFVRRATVSLSGDESPLAEVDNPSGEARETLAFSPSGGEDLGDAVHARKLKLALTLDGTLPDEDWATDVEACFYVEATIRYLE